ncbi:hypothetical protein CV_0123 [Chromobacterium violaceum ATCC 12472]|uniref:Uncharacterized protein n=1 Tax=Chromobacterium violaceum (strain ATCC 12472 / DSM 30191 / JCM 1249 / CCUG 213 / NBRC 12614 / NCIMB 9131 / NCTC 9757 / MK) TaxID=243365 RepID=Q7P1T9_CHRVO|nr:hypothetical protein CV_0123 [Chromobacterium violaceum ATCC 12472]
MLRGAKVDILPKLPPFSNLHKNFINENQWHISERRCDSGITIVHQIPPGASH